MKKIAQFALQWIIVGLAIAFIVLYLTPGFSPQTRIVEFREASGGPSEAANGRLSIERLKNGFRDTVKSAAPAVVYINTARVVTQQTHPIMQDQVFQGFLGNDSGQPRQRLETGLGSGVIVSPQGYVLTNYHVIAEADEIRVQLNDGRDVIAHIIGTDPETDLAVLQIELEPLPVIELGQSETLEVGDLVLAIGNPFGVGQAVTMGIVSATGRDELGVTTFENFIQTDAAINPGNSGGALVNPDGQLVGINTAVFGTMGMDYPAARGIGFAIPVSLARDIMQQIIARGYVTRGWLGIEVQDIRPQLAGAVALEKGNGALIRRVQQEGPAEKAGINSGDIILAVDGVDIRGARHALDEIASTRPNQSAQIKILRRGVTFSLEVLPALRKVHAP